MAQGKLGHDLIAVSPALSLTQHIALLDQLGQDPVSRAFGDPDRGGDIPQADTGVIRHAHEDVGVVRQEVPAGWHHGCLLLISGNFIHVHTIQCLLPHRKEADHGRNRHHSAVADTGRAFGDAAAVPDAARIAHARRIADPSCLTDSGQINANGDEKMTAPNATAALPSSAEEAQLPFAGYDQLDARKVVRGLSDHSQVELEAVESYERSHKGREAVLDKLRYMRQGEPLPGYDALSVEEIHAALEEADMETIKDVRSYERKFAGRREVLEAVVRVHTQRREAQPAAAVPAYQPASASAGASPRDASS
jgi:hypothetical protein